MIDDSAVGELERRHDDDCACVRCKGFERRNTVGMRHGAYANLALAPLAAEHAEELRRLVPLRSESDEPTIRLLSIAMARIDRAEAALARVDEASEDNPLAGYVGELGERVQELRRDLRSWVGTAGRLADSLGLSVTARARLGLDVARTENALEAYLAEHYAEESPK